METKLTKEEAARAMWRQGAGREPTPEELADLLAYIEKRTEEMKARHKK